MLINNTLFSVDLSDILEELRTQLALNRIPLLQKVPKRSGNSLQIQCPYHGNGMERKPSAGIRMSDGMFHCFACGQVHTLPEFISFCFGHTDDIIGKYGWQWLVKNFATAEIEERKGIHLDLNRNNISVKQDIDYVTEEELDSYRYYHPYWTKRGITSDRILDLFDLGFDKNTNCITFPVRNKDGNCLFVARRNVSTKFFSYPKGVEKPLYGLYELTHADNYKQLNGLVELFVCESMIDALLLWEYNYYALAFNGTGNDIQYKQLEQLPCRKIIIATDNDEAGQKAANRIRYKVKNKLFTRLQLPKGTKDIGECTPEMLRNIKQYEVF